MKRRHLLAASSGGTLLGVSGCLGSLPSPVSENDDEEESGELEYPNHPGELEYESAREYVTEYEEVHLARSLQQYDNVGVRCDVDQTVVNYQTETGLYFTTNECTTNTSQDVEGGNGTGTSMSDPAFYLITAETTVRIGPERQEHDEPYLTEDQTENDATGVWLTNFRDEPQEVTLRIDHRAREPITVLEDTFDLAPGSGVFPTNVFGIVGQYEFHVELEDGQNGDETLNYTGERSSLLPMGAVVLTPEEDLLVDDIEFEGYY